MISCPVASFVYKIKVTMGENLLPPAFLPPKSNYSTGHDMTSLKAIANDLATALKFDFTDIFFVTR
ncbi:MAG: hypothetical protein F6K54_12455 [Okeania sp. SIO3B5]|nr:hypothetical protein [Okeania sp. SIO3B5]